jgi:hypothetical protein
MAENLGDRCRPTDDRRDDLRWREDVQDAARRWAVDPRLIRPCVPQIRAIEKSQRNQMLYVLATEWRAMGVAEQRALELALRWNDELALAMSPREVKGIVKSAFKGDKRYGCDTHLAPYCIGKERCPYFAAHVGTKEPLRGRATMDEFRDLGWRRGYVTRLEADVYEGIISLERIRHVGEGGRVITSMRQLGRLIDASPASASVALRVLKELSLIEFQPGRPRATGLPPKGCTVVRTIPIPAPPRVDPSIVRRLRRRIRDDNRLRRESARAVAVSVEPSVPGFS